MCLITRVRYMLLLFFPLCSFCTRQAHAPDFMSPNLHHPHHHILFVSCLTYSIMTCTSNACSCFVITSMQTGQFVIISNVISGFRQSRQQSWLTTIDKVHPRPRRRRRPWLNDLRKSLDICPTRIHEACLLEKSLSSLVSLLSGVLLGGVRWLTV